MCEVNTNTVKKEKSFVGIKNYGGQKFSQTAEKRKIEHEGKVSSMGSRGWSGFYLRFRMNV